MKQEQIIKALEYCAAEGVCDECPIDKRHKDDCVCMQHLVKLSLSLIRKLTEENDRLMGDKNYWKKRAQDRELEHDKAVKKGYAWGIADSVHKTLARVKIKCQRVSYADMAVPKVNHEIFTIKGEDLDEIEKELTNVYQSKNQRRQ